MIDAMCETLLLELGANFLIWLLLGAVLGLVGLIYSRRRIEAAVRLSEERFRTLVEASPEGIAIVDGQGQIGYVNPAYERMLGYGAAELIGRSYTDLLHPDDLAAAAGYAAALAGDPARHTLAEVRLRHRDGSWRVVESSGRLLPDGRLVGYSRDLTERRRAEEALRLAELRFRSVLAQPLLAVRIYSPDGTLLQWNSTARELFGLSEHESTALIGRYNILEDQNIARLGYGGHVRRVFAGEAVAFPPVRFGFDSARQAWSQIFMYPVTDQAGAVREVVSMSIDITAQKEAEAALVRLNEQLEDRVAERTAELERALAESRRLTAILESTPDLVGIADMEGRYTYFNRAARLRIGLGEDEDPTWLTLADVFTADSLGRIMSEGMAAALEAGSWRGEATSRNVRTGEEFPVSLVGLIHRAPDGAPQYMSGVSRDISEQNRIKAELQAARDAAETALAESRQLAAILEATTDYVGIADIQGRMTYVNRAGREMLGIARDADIRQFAIGDQVAPAFHGLVAQILPQLIAEGAWRGEIALQHSDGRAIPVSNVSVTLPAPDGTPAFLAAINRDIGDQKRVQAELQAAKEAAEAASRAKSTFLANMSHEIRTPMNAVIGMTGLLLNTDLDARQRDFVETIRTAGDSLLTVINDILDFSKIEAGKLDLEQQPFDLRACVESAVDLLAPRAEEKGVELAYSIADELPAGVVGDVARLRQILVNLLSNAIKFTERGEVVLSVAAGGGPASVVFCVRDTGIGIRPEQMGRLFQSFSQLDPSTTRVFGGTGLGLAISKRLAELMGGAMWAESAGPGQGASFSFTIAAPPAALPPRPHLLRRPELAGLRALIVDDTPTNRRILGLQLQSWEMRPVEVGAPGEALALLDAGERFDLAILDMDLPEMDGVALGEAILARPAGAGTPMLMLTSLGQTGADPCMQIFAACLAKPVKSSQLYDALVGIFAAKEAAAPPPAPAAEPELAGRLPLRILVAEDVAVNQKFALLALEDLGYRADIAANGLEVLAAVARQPYDVILMDVQMPELDGLEATRRIRQLWRAPHGLPVAARPYIVAMTANALQGDRELCLEAGMDDYISKPVYLEELRAALERAGAGRAALAPPLLDAEVVGRLAARPRGRELLRLFAAESAEIVARIRVAAASADREGLRAAAHSLKGSSRYVGATHLAELSAAIEQQARAAGPADSAGLAAELAAIHSRTLDAIDERLAAQEVP